MDGWISSALGSAGNWPGQVVAAAEVAVEMQHHSHGSESLCDGEFIAAVLRVKVLKMDGF